MLGKSSAAHNRRLRGLTGSCFRGGFRRQNVVDGRVLQHRFVDENICLEEKGGKKPKALKESRTLAEIEGYGHPA